MDELQNFRKILLEAAQAISMRYRFLDRLRSLALTDDLTGLYNRRGFLLLGLQNPKLADRTGYPLLLFFADIDQFKRVNDSLGHLGGDAFLIGCAEVLKSTFRVSRLRHHCAAGRRRIRDPRPGESREQHPGNFP